MMANRSDRAVTIAVKGMLPKNSLGRAMLTKLRVYKGAEHEQQAQKPEIWNF
jgi:large subunit ribosomal protein L13